ncbi:inter-alpha-trypsin inhibitor heavy chain H3-like [Argonauta hians]
MLLHTCHVLLVLLATTFVSGNNERTEIKYLHIQSDIRMRFATTQITSVMANNLNQSAEVTFQVYLPDQAFITNFSMIIEGVEYGGQVKEKEVAAKIYKKAKKRGQSAGQVSQQLRETNKFKVQINVAAKKDVKFQIQYQELLTRKLSIYEHLIYVKPNGPVNDFKIEVFLAESKELTFLQVPPLRPLNSTLDINETGLTNTNAEVSRPSIKSAKVTYRRQGQLVDGIFVIKYDIDRRKKFNGDIMAVNGYFVHFFVPTKLEPLSKDVIFILDTSGSMSGLKLRQLKAAMRQIVHDMTEGDRFNLMIFNTRIKFWKQEMMVWNRKNNKAALTWLQQQSATSSTDINEALLNGIDLLNKFKLSQNETRSEMMIFLTDGEATSGVRDKNQILDNVLGKNKNTIPIFSLSFGADADFKLLQKISLHNQAVARRIYEASDASLQLKNFYNEISAALMMNLKFKYFDDQVANDSLTDSEFHQYFQGSESVIAGRLHDESASELRWNVVGSTSSGGVDFTDTSQVFDPSKVGDGIGLLQNDDIKAIPEKLWAYLTIKQIFKKILVTDSPEEIEELKKQALELSLKYKFVTPVTSMVVVKPDEEEEEEKEEKKKDDKAVYDDKTPARSKNRSPSGGRRGGGASGDPHFLVYVQNLTDPVCFSVQAKRGETLTLISDQEKGINITAKMVASKVRFHNGNLKTFIGKIFIRSPDANVTITPAYIIFNGQKYHWKNETWVTSNNSALEINGKGHSLMIKLSKEKQFLIERSMAGSRKLKVDYLNFNMVVGRGFSNNVTGHIGEFIHLHAKLRHTRETSAGKIMGKLSFRKPHQKRFIERATFAVRRDMIDSDVPCWVLHHNIF